MYLLRAYFLWLFPKAGYTKATYKSVPCLSDLGSVICMRFANEYYCYMIWYA